MIPGSVMITLEQSKLLLWFANIIFCCGCILYDAENNVGNTVFKLLAVNALTILYPRVDAPRNGKNTALRVELAN